MKATPLRDEWDGELERAGDDAAGDVAEALDEAREVAESGGTESSVSARAVEPGAGFGPGETQGEGLKVRRAGMTPDPPRCREPWQGRTST